MDLDSRAYSKLINENNTYGGSEEYMGSLLGKWPSEDFSTKIEIFIVLHFSELID